MVQGKRHHELERLAVKIVVARKKKIDIEPNSLRNPFIQHFSAVIAAYRADRDAIVTPAAHQLQRSIGRARIDDNDLHVRVLLEHQPLKCDAEHCSRVIGRNDDAYLRVFIVVVLLADALSFQSSDCPASPLLDLSL